MRKLICVTSFLLAVAALSSSTFAQNAPTPTPAPGMMDGKMEMKEGQMLMVTPDGKVQAVKPDAGMNTMMSKEGKMLPGSMMMKMEGGKMKMMQDMKMPDGKMMSEHMMMMK